jgi:prepilin-type N-terminal cleavage/methylation domain-containing protein
MRKGFTFTELLIVMAILGGMFLIVPLVKFKSGNNRPLMTVEVLCPLTTTEAIRDTVHKVRRFTYFNSNLEVYTTVNDKHTYKQYPNTCVVREVTNGF